MSSAGRTALEPVAPAAARAAAASSGFPASALVRHRQRSRRGVGSTSIGTERRSGRSTARRPPVAAARSARPPPRHARGRRGSIRGPADGGPSGRGRARSPCRRAPGPRRPCGPRARASSPRPGRRRAQAGSRGPAASRAATRNDARFGRQRLRRTGQELGGGCRLTHREQPVDAGGQQRSAGSSTGPGAVRSAFCRAASVGRRSHAGSRAEQRSEIGRCAFVPERAAQVGFGARQPRAPGAGRRQVLDLDRAGSGQGGSTARPQAPRMASRETARAGSPAPATGQDSRAAHRTGGRRIGPMRASVAVARRGRRLDLAGRAPGCPRWRGTRPPPIDDEQQSQAGAGAAGQGSSAIRGRSGASTAGRGWTGRKLTVASLRDEAALYRCRPRSSTSSRMPPTPRPARGPHRAAPQRPGGLARSVVLVGLMGAGKTSIGRRLAQRAGRAVQGCRRGDRGRRRDDHPRHLRRVRRGRASASWSGGWWRGCWSGRRWCWRWAAARSSIPETRARVTARARLGLAARPISTRCSRAPRASGQRPLLAGGDPRDDAGRPDGASATRSMPRRTSPSTRRPSRTRRWSSGSWRWSQPPARRPMTDGQRALAVDAGRAQLRHHDRRRPARARRRAAGAAASAAADDRRHRRAIWPRTAHPRPARGGAGTRRHRAPDHRAAGRARLPRAGAARAAGGRAPGATAPSAARPWSRWAAG